MPSGRTKYINNVCMAFLGGCVHNAFGKASEEYRKDIEQLCSVFPSLFKYSATRREGYHTLQAAMGLEMHNFVKHTEMRWLLMGHFLV